ncbi:MAG: methylmalonyl Co-A mutase-associated GTPase MeaB [Candidatus Zixiibacteriota bacterium]|nr:MAG: methylmalonyl Co-A mutase-associated GTPase MeaB [candidate division Zixibacteria bacterium]
MDRQTWIDRFEQGDLRALSRVISWIENGGGDVPAELKPIFSRVGRAFRVGVTGPPGAGKSTLVDGLSLLYRQEGRTVGVIAVDPSSPFSGGALLGDRVRMNRAGVDPGVFIRSMATRGSLGGLAEAAMDAADVLDVFGKDVVILETVGVGQSELDVARAADSTVVVLVPESGDSVQAMKAGLMEIGDIFVLNKSDRPAADHAADELRSALELKSDMGAWLPPVLSAVASRGQGLPELMDTLKQHHRHLAESGALREKRVQRRRQRIQQITEKDLLARFWNPDRLARRDQAAEAGENPFSVAGELVKGFPGKKEDI